MRFSFFYISYGPVQFCDTSYGPVRFGSPFNRFFYGAVPIPVGKKRTTHAFLYGAPYIYRKKPRFRTVLRFFSGR